MKKIPKWVEEQNKLRELSKKTDKSTYQIQFERGDFPKCYTPCPPFYDICNHGCWVFNNKPNKEYNKCHKCFNKFLFTDSIE